MNIAQNPCFSLTASSNCPATVFAAPKLGRIALPTHLVTSVYCPHHGQLVITYSGVTIKVVGRNLGTLMEGLSSHRLRALNVVEELTYSFTKTDVFVSDIEVIITK